MTKGDVPRIGRVLDAVGLALFVAGAGVYGWSWLGLRSMDEFRRAPGDSPYAAVERADALASLGRIGFYFMAAGAVVAVLAAVVARRIARDRNRPGVRGAPRAEEPRDPGDVR